MSTAVITTAAGDVEALQGHVALERMGPWLSRIEAQLEAPLAGAATITLASEEGAPVELHGTVIESDAAEGFGWALIVGGAGRLRQRIPPRSYVGVATARRLVEDILAATAEGGIVEQLEGGVSETLEAFKLARWDRAAMTAKEAIAIVAARFDLSWRVLENGRVWLGLETWSTVSEREAGTYEGTDVLARELLLAPPAARLRPGVVLLDRQIEAVTYQITGGVLRARARYEVA